MYTYCVLGTPLCTFNDEMHYLQKKKKKKKKKKKEKKKKEDNMALSLFNSTWKFFFFISTKPLRSYNNMPQNQLENGRCISVK